jgi:putative hydrolase of HD superfamily
MDLVRFSQQIKFIIEIDNLKKVQRQTWLMDASRQETVAEHSWHITLMAILLAEHSNVQQIDLLKVVKMLLIHDLVEINAGDTFLYDKISTRNQSEREQKAANQIFGLLPIEEKNAFKEIWEEFEANRTPEAQFARAIDAFQPVLQAFQNGGCSWKKHNVIKSQILETKRPLMKGSDMLWNYLVELLDQAVERQILREAL